MSVMVNMYQYPTLDFDKYLLDLTKGDNILYDAVRKKCTNPEYNIIFYFANDRYYSDSKIGYIDLFRILAKKYGTEKFYTKLDYFDWDITMSFNLVIEILKNPNSIFSPTETLVFCELYDIFLRELLEGVRNRLEKFVEVIKSEIEQKRLQLAWKKEQERLELERKKEQERLELERKKEQEQLELERKKEQEQLELEHKRKQKQLEKEKEGNEKKLKQNKIDTIVSYFFNRNLN